MSEQPLERLNYYNGQRLQATDLRLEQDYHIRVRRWLNRSLYDSGIADGLSVYAIAGQPRVRVTPGLAIDHLGREIILLDEQIVDVVGRHHVEGARCRGPYLTIRYQEETVSQEEAGCAVGGHSADRRAWGGPARILSGAALELNPALPNEESGRIPLACLTLGAGCAAIDQVDTAVRRYIGAASATKVKQYALEGERHVDPANPGRIRFHIRGRQPNAVALYLRAEQFSTLFYTELGRHLHDTSGAGYSVTVPAHEHSIPAVEGRAGSTGAAGHHTPSSSDIRAWLSPVTNPSGNWAIRVALMPRPAGNDRSLRIWSSMSITFDEVIDHWHAIPSATGSEPARPLPLDGRASTANAGISDVLARSASAAVPQTALTFVSDLQIFIGPDVDHLTRVTDDVLVQLRGAQPDGGWTRLGDGNSTHLLATRGSGEIRLHFLPGVTLGEGEYVIELRVAAGGGRVHFNLYVE